MSLIKKYKPLLEEKYASLNQADSQKRYPFFTFLLIIWQSDRNSSEGRYIICSPCEYGFVSWRDGLYLRYPFQGDFQEGPSGTLQTYSINAHHVGQYSHQRADGPKYHSRNLTTVLITQSVMKGSYLLFLTLFRKEEEIDWTTELTLPSTIAQKISEMEGKMKRHLPSSLTEVKRVFLTGCTGVVGVSLLKELICSSTATIYCLVRSVGEKTAQERLEDSMKAYKEYNFFQQHLGDRILTVRSPFWATSHFL